MSPDSGGCLHVSYVRLCGDDRPERHVQAKARFGPKCSGCFDSVDSGSDRQPHLEAAPSPMIFHRDGRMPFHQPPGDGQTEACARRIRHRRPSLGTPERHLEHSWKVTAQDPAAAVLDRAPGLGAIDPGGIVKPVDVRHGGIRWADQDAAAVAVVRPLFPLVARRIQWPGPANRR